MMSKKVLFSILIAVLILTLILFYMVRMSRVKTGMPDSAERGIPSLTLYVMSDSHYLSSDLTDNGDYFMRMIENSDAKAMEFSEEITDAFVNRVIEDKPDYLIITGDLTYNGEKDSHLTLSEKLKKIEEEGTQVLVIPGNHDLYSKTAASFHGSSYEFVDSITSTNFSNIYQDFGFSEALSRDEDSLSYTYELAPDLWMLFLDVNTRTYPGSLSWATYDWARLQLETAKEKGIHVIVGSHQNVLMHNALFNYDYVIGGHNKLTSLYEELGVALSLSGHMHIQHIEESPGGLTEIASSALSVSPCQFGIIGVYPEGLDYHTESVDFDHAEEAAEFMQRKAYAGAKKRFPEGGEALWEFYTNINYNFFSGRGDLMEWSDDFYAEIKDTAPNTGSLLDSILEDGFRDHTRAFISF